jgi:acetyl-CoA C-acetyltransferase
MILDGLWDPYNDCHMGACAEAHAAKHGVSREEQDDHALASHERARRAAEAGFSGRVRSWHFQPIEFFKTGV